MEIEPDSQGVAYKDRSFYCGPGLSVVLEDDNRLTIVFRRVKSWLDQGLSGRWHPSTETCITHSDDIGATWTHPRALFSGW